jgi:membrane associated rhomboid family serine protease
MSYYRTASVSFGPPLTRVVKQLIIFTVGAFALTYLPAVIFHWRFPPPLLGLRPFEVTRYFAIWELATYLFLHAGFFHILFNLFALWMFGCDLESLWGPRRFLFFFFLTGVGAGLINVLLEPSSIIATVGNSGAVYGILLAYGLIFPDRPIFLWLLIPVKAKWFVLGMGIIEFVSELSRPASGISHLAHLGGMLFAFLYLRGGGLSHRMQLRYNEWRRARLRRKFEVYVRKHEKKDESGRWIN